MELLRLTLLLGLSCLCLMLHAQTHPHPESSVGFEFEGFKCRPVPCPRDLTMLHSAFAHMVVGTAHESAIPLLVHRVCGLLQQCVDPKRMRLVLHDTHSRSDSRSRREQVEKARRFLGRMSVPYVPWNGTFSADSKMSKSFETLRGIHAHDTVILQMDVDEEPDMAKFNQALGELEAQRCDAVYAYWQDRLADNGTLASVELTGAPLVEQFPLQCDLSGQVVRGGKTSKTIAYRADSRLDGGQHDVWCDRPGKRDRSSKWNKTSACAQHAHDRAKSRLLPLVLANVPNLAARPRYCHTKVPLRHYKFTRGVDAYLEERMTSYRKQGLHWWRDSKLFVEHLRSHGGRVCVECQGMKCVDTRTGTRLAENAEELAFQG